MKERNHKKKGDSFIGVILAIIVILAIVGLIYLLIHGGGIGKGKGNNEDSTATSKIEQVTEEKTTEEIIYIEVKVSGDKFSVDGEETDIKDIVGAVKGKGDNIIVNIVDDGAVNDSMEALRDALSEGGVKFVDPEVE